MLQLEARLAELSAAPFEDLTAAEVKELGQLRRERRAILSDPDPERICAAHNRDGSPCGNPAERGKRVCWNHGGTPGSGPPKGSKNALKTGEYEAIWMDTLDEEESALISEIDTDPISQANETIRLLTIRERRMMKRIQDLKNGLTEKQRRVLQERRTVKETQIIHDDSTGQTKVVTVPRDEMVVTEVEEKEYRIIDDIIRLEEALTRVQDKKVKAIKVKHELMGEAERQVRIEKLKSDMEISRERLELEKKKAEQDGDGDEKEIYVDTTIPGVDKEGDQDD